MNPADAIFVLLAAAEAEHDDEVAATWLNEQDLLRISAGGVAELTDRGRAWLKMIVATPLPQLVSMWADPRGTTGDTGPIIHSVPMPPASKPIAAGALPAGFIPNTFADLPAGALPPGLARDTELRIAWRDGKVGKRNKHQPPTILAGSVNWKQSGKPDDVVGYQIVVGGEAPSPE